MSEITYPTTRRIGRAAAGRLSWFVFLLAAGLLAFEFLRAAWYVASAWGLPALALDGLVHFQVGELLIALPLLVFVFLRPGWDAARQLDFVRRSRWLVWAGALLNIAAYFGLRARVDWVWWPLALAVFGLLLPTALTALARRGLGWAGWLLVALFFLLQAAAYLTAILFNGYAFTPLPARYPPPAATRDERWEQDARYLASELARLHKNAFHTVSPETFAAHTEQMVAAIPHLTDQQVAIRMMSIAAQVGDAHTGIGLQSQMKVGRYPLNLYWFQDGLFVIGAKQDLAQVLKARVVRIGDRTAEEALEAVRPLIAHENESWLKHLSPQYLLIPEVLHAVGVIAAPGPASFVFELPGGEQVETVITPLQPGERWDSIPALAQPMLYQKNQGENFWFEYLAESGTLYFKYNACNDPAGFRNLMNELWKTVDENPVQRLIVDFRGNGGGNSLQFDRYFLPGIRQRPTLNQPERLYGILNRGTFSSASDNALTLDLQTEATLVGEPSGGRPNGYGEVRSFRLPNSGLRVHFSTRYFHQTERDDPSVQPEIPVQFISQDYFAGRDIFLEAALGQKTQP